MTDIIVIRLHDSEANLVSWHPLGKTPSPQGPRGIGTLADAAEQIKGWRLVVIAPSTDILLTDVSIPSKNKQRLLQAIPFALENDLTEDIEQLHFAIDLHSNKDVTTVAVISRERLKFWLDKLNSLDLQPLAIYPEPLCLPLEIEHWSAHLDTEGVLLCMDKCTGFGTEIENFPTLLKICLAQKDRPEQLDLYLAPGIEQNTTIHLFDDLSLKINKLEYAGDLTSFLSENLDEKHTLNLLQGEFQQIDRKAVQWRRWVPAAALFTVLIGINIISSTIDYAHYKEQSFVLNKEIQRVFREAFPETKRIVDPKVQMEQQLNLLKGNNKSDQTNFLTLIYHPATILAKNLGAQLESLNFRDNQIDLKLTLKDLQSLETIKKSIETHDDLSVEIKSANASGNQVTSHLRIKRGSI